MLIGMVIGIGVDLIDVERIARACARPGFLERVLTPEERADLRERFGTVLSPGAARWVAGRWAIKEATAKCVGCHLGWQDVQVTNDGDGRPIVKCGQRAGLQQGDRVWVSLSHERKTAVAVVLWERL